jgi:hypothetical protein
MPAFPLDGGRCPATAATATETTTSNDNDYNLCGITNALQFDIVSGERKGIEQV